MSARFTLALRYGNDVLERRENVPSDRLNEVALELVREHYRIPVDERRSTDVLKVSKPIDKEDIEDGGGVIFIELAEKNDRKIKTAKDGTLTVIPVHTFPLVHRVTALRTSKV